MPRRYADGYPAPPDDRGGGAIFVVLLAISVLALALGAGWLSLNVFLGEKQPKTAAVPTASVMAATPSARAVPTPPAVPAATAMRLAVADWDIPNGHFFTETNGAPPRSSAKGFAVTNDGGMPFWAEFQRLGGTSNVGYPLSGRFRWLGRETQVFQRAILQWNPTLRQTQAANILDELHNQDKDQWLFEAHATPKPLSADFDRGRSVAEAARSRLALLDGDPAMQAFYQATADPMTLYGLPASLITDMGSHYALRLQRGVLQRWKVDQPWARAGQVTAANSGQLAAEAGLMPPEPLQPQAAPQLPQAPAPANN